MPIVAKGFITVSKAYFQFLYKFVPVHGHKRWTAFQSHRTLAAPRDQIAPCLPCLLSCPTQCTPLNMMIVSQPSPLPPLSSDDCAGQTRNNSFDSSAVYEGTPPMASGRPFEAKAVNLKPRPKTSLGTSRSYPGFPSPSASPSASPSMMGGCHPAPR